ncbi:MAG: DUF4177 domain-containing protein [Pseudorhodobacter sp.]
MRRYEYRVVPAPTKGEKAKAAKTTSDRFAVAMMNVMNSLGAEGWDYVRADTLPCEERVGFTGTKTVFQNMLVFRRELAAQGAERRPRAQDHAQAPQPVLTASEAATLIAPLPVPDQPASGRTTPPVSRRVTPPDNQAAE